MFIHRLSHRSRWQTIAEWFALTFSAGVVNVGGFLVTGRFVTHVTGFATLFGADLGSGLWKSALGILSVPIFFLGGSFLAGWLIDGRILRKQAPRFDWVMGGSAICLLLVAVGTSAERIAPFGAALHLGDVYRSLALLCLSSGLQNAALTSSSGSSVRTTHLTGLTTDLGIGLARQLFAPPSSPRASWEGRVTRIRMGTIIAFIMGSAVGAVSFIQYGRLAFLLPAAISTYAAVRGRNARIYAHRAVRLEP